MVEETELELAAALDQPCDLHVARHVAALDASTRRELDIVLHAMAALSPLRGRLCLTSIYRIMYSLRLHLVLISRALWLRALSRSRSLLCLQIILIRMHAWTTCAMAISEDPCVTRHACHAKR